MTNIVELQYNPYIPQLRILIDKVPPSDFSRLVQYTDEDIWFWGVKILDTLYSEIRNTFSVIFTGTKEDAAVMKLLCGQKKFCQGFYARKFAKAEVLQSRMKTLNQIIKRKEDIRYRRTEVEAVFYIPAHMTELADLIQTLEICNLFCNVRVRMIHDCIQYRENENSVLFIVVDKTDEVSRQMETLHTKNPVFAIVVGKSRDLLAVTETVWIFETPEEDFCSAVFQCFMQEPLLWAFRKCIKSLEKTEKEGDEIQKLVSVEPAVTVSVEEKIEVGKSAKIQIVPEYETVPVPKLIYKIPEKEIAFCDGLCVFGKKEGTATLEVYYQGEKKPFAVKKVEIIKRERIKNLVLSENELEMGVGDRKKLICTYFPEQADNADSIMWVSSNENIVKCDGKGALEAVSEGVCQVMCIAENISANCICLVKPYLEEIAIVPPLEKDILYLEPLEEHRLRLRCMPEGCIDGELFLHSSDCDAVNVVGSVLYAKNKGKAYITVKNASGRVSYAFWAVIVQKHKGIFSFIKLRRE